MCVARKTGSCDFGKGCAATPEESGGGLFAGETMAREEGGGGLRWEACAGGEALGEGGGRGLFGDSGLAPGGNVGGEG
jgi:hypothetical protein